MGATITNKIKFPVFNNIVIATFSSWKNKKRTPTNGMIEPLLSYFENIAENITIIDAQHPGSDTIIPCIEHYIHGKLVKSTTPSFLFPPLWVLNHYNVLKTQPAFKIRDFITTAEVLFKHKGKVNLFIGLESIFTLVGILFKKIGKVKTVVYYVSDYSPSRYSSSFFNTLYLWLDRFCATHADYIWDVSPAMHPARIKYGLDPNNSAPCILVPNALFPWQIKHRAITELKPYSLAFAGTIGPENGLDLAIESLVVIKKYFSKVTLHIFGGGLKADEQKAKKLIREHRLEKNVVDHGFVSDLRELSSELSKCMIGLAPYRAIPSSVRWYADATKLRLYFANGLPVVSTQVPPLAHETSKVGSTIITEDTVGSFASGVLLLMRSSTTYSQMRKKAKEYAKYNTWKNTYQKALEGMRL
jgi:glycosyltransferase involved in cell wall biosynthesis